MAVESKSIAEFNREYGMIKATSAGKILKKFLNEGELAGPGTPVFYVNSAGQNEWVVKLAVPDVDWVRIKIGDKAKINLDVIRDESLDGEVSLIGEAADPFTGLYSVEVSIAKTSTHLAAGLFASVEITPENPSQLSKIPIESLVEGTGHAAYAFTLDADKKHVNKIKVNISYIDDKSAYVSKGLEGIGHVITSGSGFLTPASLVIVIANN